MFDFRLCVWLSVFIPFLSVTYPNLLLPTLINYLSNDVDILPFLTFDSSLFKSILPFWKPHHQSPLLFLFLAVIKFKYSCLIIKIWELYRSVPGYQSLASLTKLQKKKKGIKVETGNFFPIIFLHKKETSNQI